MKTAAKRKRRRSSGIRRYRESDDETDEDAEVVEVKEGVAVEEVDADEEIIDIVSVRKKPRKAPKNKVINVEEEEEEEEE